MLSLPGAAEEEAVMNFSRERCFQGIPGRYNPNPSYQTGLLVLGNLQQLLQLLLFVSGAPKISCLPVFV